MTDGDEGTNVQTPPSGGELGTQVSLKDPAVGSTLITHPSLLAKPLVDQAGGSPVLWAEVERGVPRLSRRWGRGWGSPSAVSPLPGPSRVLWETQQGDDGGKWALGSRKDSSSTVPRWDGLEVRLQGLLLWTWLEPLKAAAGLLSGVAGRRLRAARGSRAGSEGRGLQGCLGRGPSLEQHASPWGGDPHQGGTPIGGVPKRGSQGRRKREIIRRRRAHRVTANQGKLQSEDPGGREGTRSLCCCEGGLGGQQPARHTARVTLHSTPPTARLENKPPMNLGVIQNLSLHKEEKPTG